MSKDKTLKFPFHADLGLLSDEEKKSHPWYEDLLDKEYLSSIDFGELELILIGSGVHHTQAGNVKKRIRVVKVAYDQQHPHEGFIASQAEYVDPRLKIVDVIVMDSDGGGSPSDLLKGMKEGVKNSVGKVISMSLGSDAPMDEVEEYILELEAEGYIVIAARGNDGSDIDYPGVYAISVGSVGKEGDRIRLSDFSSRGESQGLVAPGEGIRGKVHGGTVKIWNGTSMATIYPAMLAVYLKDLYPQMTSIDFVNIISKTSEDYGCAGYDDDYGYGLLNIKGSIEYAKIYFDKVPEIIAYNVEPTPKVSFWTRLLGFIGL